MDDQRPVSSSENGSASRAGSEPADKWVKVPFMIGTHWLSLRLLTGGAAGRSGHVLRSFKIEFREKDVRIVLCKDAPDGPKVAFIEAESFEWALWALCHGVKSKTIQWHPDKFRTMRKDKS